MTVAPLPGRSPISAGRPSRPHGRLAEWAVGSAAVFGVAFAVSIGTIAIAYAAGVESAVEDNWLGALLVFVAFAGVVGSLAAFAMAIVARIRHERWKLLWLPLCLLPGLIAFVILGEAFLWE